MNEVLTVKMTRKQAIAYLSLARMRQDDLRKVTTNDRGYAKCHKLDLELEKLKMVLAEQVPSAQ